MSAPSRTRPAFKFWLETDEGHVFGPGVYSILRLVRDTGTLKDAAESLGMSYRYAWGLVKKAEEKLGEPLLLAHKGGREGGGGAELTDVGLQFLAEFSKIEALMTRISRSDFLALDLAESNHIRGSVSDMKLGDDEAEVHLRLDKASVMVFNLPKNLVAGGQVKRGDSLCVEFIPLVGSIIKAQGHSRA